MVYLLSQNIVLWHLLELDPKKKYISKIPPIARKVIAGDGCNITSKNIEHYNIIDSIHVEKKNFNFNI